MRGTPPTEFVSFFVVSMKENRAALKHPSGNTALGEVYKKKKTALIHHIHFLNHLNSVSLQRFPEPDDTFDKRSSADSVCFKALLLKWLH